MPVSTLTWTDTVESRARAAAAEVVRRPQVEHGQGEVEADRLAPLPSRGVPEHQDGRPDARPAQHPGLGYAGHPQAGRRRCAGRCGPPVPHRGRRRRPSAPPSARRPRRGRRGRGRWRPPPTGRSRARSAGRAATTRIERHARSWRTSSPSTASPSATSCSTTRSMRATALPLTRHHGVRAEPARHGGSRVLRGEGDRHPVGGQSRPRRRRRPSRPRRCRGSPAGRRPRRHGRRRRGAAPRRPRPAPPCHPVPPPGPGRQARPACRVRRGPTGERRCTCRRG